MKLEPLLRLLMLSALLTRAAVAQVPARVPLDFSVPGSELTVTLVTFGLGEEVFERFGHNALWIHDARTGSDVGYHWGLFGFNEPHFIMRFVTGDTHYWMGRSDIHQQIEREVSVGRPVTLQKLNLTPSQALKLRDFVEWNALDANKFYRYDYFRDNCSTRLRDALDLALGGIIRKASDGKGTALSYRRESVRLTDGNRPVQLGIDVALGRPADAALTAWQSFFIPMRLRDALRVIDVPGDSGVMEPLVAQEVEMPLPPGVHAIDELASAPSIAWRELLIGCVLAAIVIGLRVMMASRRSAAWGLALFGATWSLVCGIIGTLVLLAWFFTRHVFWQSNENVLLMNPLSLLLVLLAPAAVLSSRFELPARIVSSTLAVFAVIALALAMMPGGQENRAVVAIVLPMQIAIAFVLWLPMPPARRLGS